MSKCQKCGAERVVMAGASVQSPDDELPQFSPASGVTKLLGCPNGCDIRIVVEILGVITPVPKADAEPHYIGGRTFHGLPKVVARGEQT